MQYRLLAMDMDGTVLNSRKEITPRTDRAIRAALAAGKEVLFASGRCPSEMRRELALFPEMHYALCLSGAVIFDVAAGRTLCSVTIAPELVEQILAIARQVDAMVSVYAGEHVYAEEPKRFRMSYFGCECFSALYEDCAIWVSGPEEAVAMAGDTVHKINFFCAKPEECRWAGEQLRELPLTFAQGIPNNIEISPGSVDKGTGLALLCEASGIPIEEAVAVGDEGNDVAMLRAAGLGVAMGNASPAARAAADVFTSDCDHDGVAEVIEKYLLGGMS